MFAQKSTETVTLTRNQLQTILELISQIGGMSRSESRNESKNNIRFDNKNTSNMLSDDQRLTPYWESEDMMSRSDMYLNKYKDNEPINRYSSLLMLNDSTSSNRLLSPTLTSSTKIEEMRANSVAASEASTESRHRRYAKINDSEFDWNELYRKRAKAQEYSRALDLQYQQKQRQKLEEQQKIRYEEKVLEHKIEEQRLKMKSEYDLERKLIDEKKALADKKREAVIAAIDSTTPVIKKRTFLAERDYETQPSHVNIAAIKPHTRTREMSAQTDGRSDCRQLVDTETQTDVQLLLYLLNELKITSNDKIKSNSTEVMSTDPVSSYKPLSPKKRSKTKDNTELKSIGNHEKVGPKRGVWTKNPQQMKKYIKTNDKSLNQKSNENEVKNNSNETKSDSKSLNEDNNRQKLSSKEPKNLNFLPQISGRPHSRKKWYTQDQFDPYFLS